MTSPMTLEISPEELKDRLAAGERLAVLDVREPDEVQAWPFLGSTHIPLQEVLDGRLDGLPGDREIIALCAHGNRSEKAAQVLRRRGMTARSLRGGIAAWSQVYDPATIPLPGDTAIVQLRRLGKGCLSYLVAAGGEAAVIDPSWHIERYVQTAAAMGAGIRHVIDTHLHADHISGARQLAQATGALLHLNPVERFGFDRFEPAREGDVIRIGSSRLSALAAPGHTAGSLVWTVDGHALLTGDVLFLENIGRPDLHGHAEAHARDLYRTLKRLAGLGDDMLILPGHMPETVQIVYGQPHAALLGTVRTRVHLDREDEETFVARVGRVPERPPNMAVIIEINRHGTTTRPEDAAKLEEGPNRCAVKAG